MIEDTPKPFLEHLEDLRKLILHSLAAVAVGTLLSALLLREIFAFLQHPLVEVVEARGLEMERFLQNLAPIDPLTLALQATIFCGLILASPVVFFFLGQFLLPALLPEERRLLVPAFTAGGLLFLSGMAFCYVFVLPAAIGFFIDFSDWLGWSAEWTVQNYLVFVLQMLLAFGLSFEMPLVIVILAHLGLITPDWLRRYRRHVIVGILVFAAVITPTGDPFSLSLLVVPMLLLYELSVWIAAVLERRRRAAED